MLNVKNIEKLSEQFYKSAQTQTIQQTPQAMTDYIVKLMALFNGITELSRLAPGAINNMQKFNVEMQNTSISPQRMQEISVYLNTLYTQIYSKLYSVMQKIQAQYILI